VLFTLDVFRDFHLHGASAPEWNQRYLQISRGAMQSWLAEATSGSVHVFRKWMSERVVQQGCLPEGKICFAVLNGTSLGTPRMNGNEVRADEVFILRSGDEFMLQRPAGMELLAVTFETADFQRLVDLRGWSIQTQRLLARGVVQADPRRVERLRHDLLSILAQDAAEVVAPIVFESLGRLFDDAAGARQALGSASASFIVAESHRIVAASGQVPPSIDALCARLRTSRRSLQNSFRQVADTTPVHYLRSLRLNAVRRRLMSTTPFELSVAQAATDQGFSHLSHFTERYKALFGELPSQTPRR
jgi:AraC-like DNA-binding protein